jgi:hypothetical protein
MKMVFFFIRAVGDTMVCGAAIKTTESIFSANIATNFTGLLPYLSVLDF